MTTNHRWQRKKRLFRPEHTQIGFERVPLSFSSIQNVHNVEERKRREPSMVVGGHRHRFEYKIISKNVQVLPNSENYLERYVRTESLTKYTVPRLLYYC